jgi:N-methylhydantoinase A
MGIRVGIDTGGTFTDLIAVDDRDGRYYLAKVPSNPKQPVQAISAALEQAAFDSADVDFIIVGTTIGINAVLTRTGSEVVFLTTEGFEDIPYIQRINRKNHYDFTWRKPTPFVQRRDCVGIPERTDAEGAVLRPIDLDRVREVAREVAGRGGDPIAVAVCFLFAYMNPESELAAREAIREVAPELPVSLSHEVAPIWREYERGTATILDAYLAPAVDRYVAGVTDAFERQGAGERWSLLKSNGGHALAAEAANRPSHILMSGIAGGAIGGAYFARAAQAPQAIVVDMGGTSCDVCLIVDGQPLYSSEYEIEFGLPISVPTVNTHTIGAGGGSIGWVDPGGFLQVGPQSAGADPGPACYDAGGEQPTITDANVLLGRLRPDFFLGGRLALKPELSGKALRTLGDPLGLDEVEVASSMIRIANESMANAIRITTVEQGIDPRDFAIVAMGGAGPTHACGIAESIGIDRVVVPPHPGVTSAFGALAARVRVDEVKSVALSAPGVTAAQLAEHFAALVAAAGAGYEAQSPGAHEPVIERTIAMRYQGQNYEQEIAVPEGAVDDAALETTLERYHALHEEFYGYRFDGVPIEMVRLQVTASGPDTPLPELVPLGSGDAGQQERVVDVYFEDGGFQPTPIVPRTALEAGRREGPMIVHSMDTTVVVPPNWAVEASANGLLELHRAAASAAPTTNEAVGAAGASL